LTYGNGRVTSTQIVNPGSGLVAPNGSLRGFIRDAGAVGNHAAQVAGIPGEAEFSFTVANGQLTAASIVKAGSWGAPTFPISSTNFVINIQSWDGSAAAVGTARNNNARIHQGVSPAPAGLALTAPIHGVVAITDINGGSGYTNGAEINVAATVGDASTAAPGRSPVNAGTPAAPQSASFGVTVDANGVVSNVSLSNSGIYGGAGTTFSEFPIVIQGRTQTVTPAVPATGGTFADGQAQAMIGLTIDPLTGRVVDASVTQGGLGYASAPTIHVFSSIPGVGSGAEVVVLAGTAGFTAINTGTNPNAGGTIIGVRVNNGGSGYFGRNYPANAVGVSFNGATALNTVTVVSGGSHAKDIYLGTGQTMARLNP
jgi:hypothetical protein